MNSGASGTSGRLVFSSGTAMSGNSGAILIGSGAATGACGGLIGVTVGSGTSGTGGTLHLLAGAVDESTGGEIRLNAGKGSISDGQVYLKGGSSAALTISSSSIGLQHQSASVVASSAISVASTTGLVLNGESGVTFSSGYVHGFECTSSATPVSSASATVNTMGGILTSESTSLGSGSAETITLSNGRITTSSIIWVSVKSRCSLGYVAVASVTANSGSATIITYNLGDVACGSNYQLIFFVFN
jgi:hypothetical protein